MTLDFLSLVYFASCNAFKFHLFSSKWQHFVLLYRWIKFHCQNPSLSPTPSHPLSCRLDPCAWMKPAAMLERPEWHRTKGDFCSPSSKDLWLLAQQLVRNWVLLIATGWVWNCNHPAPVGPWVDWSPGCHLVFCPGRSSETEDWVPEGLIPQKHETINVCCFYLLSLDN